MTLIRRLFFGLIVFILLVGLVGFFLPSTGHAERSITIDAPPDAVYDVVRDFDQFNAWSPWYGLDPDARYELSGTRGNIGSRLTWYSEKPEVGNGSQTIARLEPHSLIELDLEFAGQPPAKSAFVLAPQDSGTQVTWTFDTDFGANPFLHYFGLLMDTFVGPAYEQGLAQLKDYVENGASSQ